ncbi:MAG: hypothetical protein M1820_003563 [Bogoriella megaspora]|nr:MAG: hypothetical protein M1820_003563 [Bogoriella megaspora]
MSATRNTDAVANQGGEFHSSVERSEPLTTHGHKPGVLASEADRAPEFSAQTLPAGTAPRDRTFAPNANNEAPPLQDYSSNVDPEAERTSAADTLGGATSGDVHTGLGHPGQGQSSAERHHDGQSHRKHQGNELAGLSGAQTQGERVVDGRDPGFTSQRALEKDVEAGTRGTVGGPAAEERIPESAEGLASERR